MTNHLQIRGATADDVPGIRGLLSAHGNDGPIATVDIVGPYVRHFIDHAIALVSERNGEIVAYGAAVDTGVGRHLADLFVRPDLLGHGIGRPLLDAVFGIEKRRTTFASADPRALPLYVRAGMTPFWPSFYLEGLVTRLPSPNPEIEIESAGPVRLAGLEAAWTGATRLVDHVFWASQAGAEPFVVSQSGEPVAFGYARSRQVDAARAVDRLLVRPSAEPLGPTLAAIRQSGRGALVAACVLGPNPILAVLLGAGFQITDRDLFMASDPSFVDPMRLLPNPGML